MQIKNKNANYFKNAVNLLKNFIVTTKQVFQNALFCPLPIACAMDFFQLHRASARCKVPVTREIFDMDIQEK